MTAKAISCGLLLFSGASAMQVRSATDFEDYLATYSRDYTPGSEEYNMRKELYQQRSTFIMSHNSNPDRLWTAGFNHLTDRTEVEMNQLMGRIHHAGRGGGYVPAGLLSERSQVYGEPAESVDWRHLSSVVVKDQGMCGSCWALATSSLLELSYEVHMNATRTFSVQELVDCVPNPQECGGTGGCQGATVELALAYAQANGLATSEETPYSGGESHTQCQNAASLAATNSMNAGSVASTIGGMKFGLAGYTTLPSNKALPLMLSLMEGPVAVSVGASDWMPYMNGIFNGCNKDSVINHAVLAVGYGSDNSVNYWTIQNSWGNLWGESGYIRLQRGKSVKADDEFCGTDNKPEDGIECKPYPESVTVCGMCGVLYDSVVAHFDPAASAGGQLASNSLRGKRV